MQLCASCLQDAFISELTILKERSKEKQLNVAAGWFSQKDMADDLNWTEHCPQHMIFWFQTHFKLVPNALRVSWWESLWAISQ